MDREAFLKNEFLEREKDKSDEYQQDVATIDVVDILVILSRSQHTDRRQQKNRRILREKNT